MNAYMNQYQQNQVLTASKEQILIMLYDGAIKFCRQAIAANNEGNLAEKLGRISKVFAIITEFSSSLNHEIGGDIAEDLDALYQFMIRELGKARKDTTGVHLENVEKLLVDLRLTWGEAVEMNRKDLNALVQQHKVSEPEVSAQHKAYSFSG